MNQEDLPSQSRQIFEQALTATLREHNRPLPEDWLFHTLADLLLTREAVLSLLQHLSVALQHHGFDGGFPPESADFFFTSTQKCGAWIGEIYNLLAISAMPGGDSLEDMLAQVDNASPHAGAVEPPTPSAAKPDIPTFSAPAPSQRATLAEGSRIQGLRPSQVTRTGMAQEPSPASEKSTIGEFTRIFSTQPVMAPEPSPTRVTQPYTQASIVRVFYATDRNQTSLSGLDIGYDANRSPNGQLHYGLCEVSIPKVHKTGHLESPSILRLEFRPDPSKHILLQQTLSFAEQEFFQQITASVQSSPLRDAFVFVHGYNVSFEDAARRTGQVAFDLQFAGAPIFYSWPSLGHFADYLRDETNVAWSAPHFERFLHLLAQYTGATRIHVIAHSMGNRAVCEALNNMSRDPATSLRLTHLVLAAPDIDAQTFAELAGALQRLSTRITLYESVNDKALQASRRIHGNPRAGEPLLIVPGLDTIDASLIDTDFLGHSYFSDNWPLLADIHSILASDESPSQRFGLVAMQHAQGNYYSFRR
ncbi:alpha/beta hydrolase [Acidicapsa dinghuensis]|uniref:Alpha/beta hydrolase n=1 Tax=Acidicapsa dinghuensis TaxID=2218256 RepID=A0ABW1EMY6_9BACT|nr:alpha/beta hydrolase [Acidicapsa dinghuensis]